MQAIEASESPRESQCTRNSAPANGDSSQSTLTVSGESDSYAGLMRGSARMAIREVTRLLRDAHERASGASMYEYQHALGETLTELERLDALPDSPLGDLFAVLQEDQRMRERLRVCCFGEAGV